MLLISFFTGRERGCVDLGFTVDERDTFRVHNSHNSHHFRLFLRYTYRMS